MAASVYVATLPEALTPAGLAVWVIDTAMSVQKTPCLFIFLN